MSIPVEKCADWEALYDDIKDGSTQAPPPRTYFGLNEYNGALYLFGGFSEQSTCSNDLYVMDPTINMSWRKLPLKGESPRQVYLHSTAVSRGKLWVFGGNSPKSVIHNDLHSYDFQTGIWSKVSALGSVPSERHGHTATATTTRMVVVGGRRTNSAFISDAYEYTFATNTWGKLKDLPFETAYHALFTFDDEIYLYGGYNGHTCSDKLFKLVESDWVEIKTNGPLPDGRCGCAYGVSGRFLFVFGGYSPREKHMDEFLRLDLSTMEWRVLSCSNTPLKRAYLQGAVCRGYFYVVGGYNGRACISDCRRASVPLNSFRGSFVLSSDMLAPGPIGLSKLNDRVDACMEKFSKTRVGWLSRNEIREMIREITTMTVADQTNQSITTTTNNANKSGSSTGNNSNSGAPEERYPFDTSLMPQVLANGFQRAHVLQVLEMLHNRGEKFDLGKLFNVLLDTPYRPGYTVKPLPSSATASTAPTPSSNSKIAESKDSSKLQSQIESLQSKLEEVTKCGICFEGERTVALIPCGHLFCDDCSGGFKSRECPLCRTKYNSTLKVVID